MVEIDERINYAICKIDHYLTNGDRGDLETAKKLLWDFAEKHCLHTKWKTVSKLDITHVGLYTLLVKCDKCDAQGIVITESKDEWLSVIDKGRVNRERVNMSLLSTPVPRYDITSDSRHSNPVDSIAGGKRSTYERILPVVFAICILILLGIGLPLSVKLFFPGI